MTVFVDRNPSLTPRQSVAIALCASSKNYNDLLMFEKAGPSRPSGENSSQNSTSVCQPCRYVSPFHLLLCPFVGVLRYDSDDILN